MHAENEQMAMVNDIKRIFTEFIQKKEQHGRLKYMQMATNTINNGKHTMVFSLKDFLHFNDEIANIIFQEYYKYQPTLNQAFTQFMLEHQKNMGVIDRVNTQLQEHKDQSYQVSFDKGLSDHEQSVRDLKCDLLGKLRSFKGTVTRTSEVRPELVMGIFTCKQCGTSSNPVVQQFKYTEPKKCIKPNCDKRVWELDLVKSKFADFQKIRVQEDPTKIPPGAMPRSIDVILRNQNTERGQPGDICEIIGCLLVLPDISSMLKPGERTQISTRNQETRGMAQMQGITGLKGVRQLNYKLVFIANNIKVENNQFDEVLEDVEEEEQVDNANTAKEQYSAEAIMSKIWNKYSQNDMTILKNMKENPKLYDDMAESLFPSIFGHSEIKKALLLQLLGGIHKKTKNKINIRGDVNMLIVGDPSSAKSQFLKCVNKFVPRSVYTNGKTTSAAGLTASVTRDENGNVGIEAGALMLADNGICCIDEFDKMELKDQVAIHEAMEQQTISIAKAGVYATLNARTSILAAANPIFGRYDKSKSLKNNINLSAPIMSRFDLFFVVCDESNPVTDAHLSDFIIRMHRRKDQTLAPKYDTKILQKYIGLAKKIKPRLTIEAAELLRKHYIDIRSKDKHNNNNSYRVTVRQLQSMIRISEAYAKLHLDLEVKPQYVKEAYRLLSCSILKLEKTPIELNQDEELERGIEKINLNNNHVNNLMEAEIKKKAEERKSKQVTLSYELYQEFQKNILLFFKDKQKQHQEQRIDEEQQSSQEDLCNYLLQINFDQGLVNSMEETQQFKKIINGVIKKLIREERMLMIVEDNVENDKKMLSMHPNYIEQ